jgi:hypothetical protein
MVTMAGLTDTNMALKQLKRLSVSETSSLEDIVRAINVIQGNVASSVDPIAINVANDSIVLINIKLFAGKLNAINHTLGRQLLGYNIMLQGTGSPTAIIANDQKNNPSIHLTLWLFTSTDCVCNIQVY